MAIRSFGAMKENRNEGRSDEGLRVWKRLRLQKRMPVQSMRLQALQLLNDALCDARVSLRAFGGGLLSRKVIVRHA